MVNFTDLSTTVVKEFEEFQFNEQTIKVRQYATAEEKFDLMIMVAEKSKFKDKPIYMGLLIDVFFQLGIVYLYSDIVFTDEDKEDEYKLYDKLKTNGIIDEVIKRIPQDEYNALVHHLNDTIGGLIRYSSSAFGVVNELVNVFSAKMKEMSETMDGLDSEKMEELVKLAEKLKQ